MWASLTPTQRQNRLTLMGDGDFNKQETASVEWALWSWNPVTGCEHNCPHCYARGFALRIYTPELGFKPALWPNRLAAPQNMSFPKAKIDAETDPWRKHGLGNVFVCSMADLFGRWVPEEWIQAVLAQCAAAPQWAFLFLIKFPIRLAEFTFADNCWVGTTVDSQARVKNAEKAFRKVKAGDKWLSCEPLLEPLRFDDLGAFDWIVLGGASKSTQTPVWIPPRRWVTDLESAAWKAGLKV
jgi:protein gp37